MTANGLVEGVAHVTKQWMIEESDRLSKAENDFELYESNVSGTLPPGHNVSKVTLELGDVAIQLEDSRDLPRDNVITGVSEGLIKEGRRLHSVSVDIPALVEKEMRNHGIAQTGDRKAEEAKVSPVVDVIWREVNEAIVIGIFAVYCHFLAFLIPTLAKVSKARDVHGAYLWGVVGLIAHVPFVLAIPGIHWMSDLSGSIELLGWATGLSLVSFAVIFFAQEMVWRKLRAKDAREVNY